MHEDRSYSTDRMSDPKFAKFRLGHTNRTREKKRREILRMGPRNLFMIWSRGVEEARAGNYKGVTRHTTGQHVLVERDAIEVVDATQRRPCLERQVLTVPLGQRLGQSP